MWRMREHVWMGARGGCQVEQGGMRSLEVTCPKTRTEGGWGAGGVANRGGVEGCGGRRKPGRGWVVQRARLSRGHPPPTHPPTYTAPKPHQPARTNLPTPVRNPPCTPIFKTPGHPHPSAQRT